MRRRIVYFATPMGEEFVDSLDDPRLRLYRNLKDAELAREGERFIVEGHFVVQRVLASDFPVESLLVAQRKLEEMRPYIPAGLPVYVVPDRLVNGIVGFQFHTGVMAVARRKPAMPLAELASRLGERAILMVLPETSSLQNMGAMIRIAAAFGVEGIVVGPGSVDPFYRLPIRVSMGTCFKVPIVRSQSLEEDLAMLKGQGFVLAATVLDADAEDLHDAVRPARMGLLFGGEGYGLDRKWVDLCHQRLTIPMKLGTDSLNVAVSAAVFLYHFAR